MSEESFQCPKKNDGCNSSFPTFNDLLTHVQNECLYFGSKYYPLLPKVIKNPESYPTPNITKFVMCNEDPIEEELPDNYFFLPTQPQRNRILKKSDKQIRAGPQKFIKDKDISGTESLEISKCLLKSNIFTVFKTVIQKKVRYFAAYPNDKYEIVVKDLVELNLPPTLLKGHKDIITEIKFCKVNNNDYIYSCSYDNTCRSWKCSNWEMKDQILYNNWVTSCTVLNDKFKSGEDFVVLAGGFNPNYPIKKYNFEGQLKGEIKLKDNSTSISITHYHDEVNQKTYLFHSTENEKGSLINMFDFHSKALIKTFPADKYATKIEFHTDNSNFLVITYVDFKGTLRQFNVETGKLIKQVSMGSNCFDLISYDEEYFIVCGDHNDHPFKIIYKDGLQVVKTYPNMHNNVILNLAFIDLPLNGKTLITLGADKQIIMYKK